MLISGSIPGMAGANKGFQVPNDPTRSMMSPPGAGKNLVGQTLLFTREDTVDAAWAVVDPVLKNHPPSIPYRRGSWGPKEVDTLIAGYGGWQNPTLA
jgi:hypothetical protein